MVFRHRRESAKTGEGTGYTWMGTGPTIDTVLHYH
jgi:hypothetical protein